MLGSTTGSTSVPPRGLPGWVPPVSEEEGGVLAHERRAATRPRGTGQGTWLRLGAAEPSAA